GFYGKCVKQEFLAFSVEGIYFFYCSPARAQRVAESKPESLIANHASLHLCIGAQPIHLKCIAGEIIKGVMVIQVFRCPHPVNLPLCRNKYSGIQPKLHVWPPLVLSKLNTI